jgi:hypothetical protein
MESTRFKVTIRMSSGQSMSVPVEAENFGEAALKALAALESDDPVFEVTVRRVFEED